MSKFKFQQFLNSPLPNVGGDEREGDLIQTKFLLSTPTLPPAFAEAASHRQASKGGGD